MRVGGLGGGVDFLRGRVEPAELDVLEDGVVKQKGLLRDEADLFAQRSAGVIARRSRPSMSEGAAGGIVKPQDERKDRALARAARADERVAFAGLDLQAEVFERVLDSRQRSGR